MITTVKVSLYVMAIISFFTSLGTEENNKSQLRASILALLISLSALVTMLIWGAS